MTRPDDLRPAAGASQHFRFFNPILAGATLKDRLVGCAGALLGITLTGLICSYLMGGGPKLPLVVAPIGASAVLLFAVPASPLAQPWPIIGGNTISAAVGMAIAYVMDDSAIAVGVAVAAAIAVMSLTRSLHPPGGAVALTAALGGGSVADWGAFFPLVPVGLNSFLLIGIGIGFHRLSGRAYPHKVVTGHTNQHQTRDLPASVRLGFNQADVDAALAALDETFDIDPGDLGRLLQRVELEALLRAHGEVQCSDVMSKDVVRASVDTPVSDAVGLLLKHNIRTLPVLDNGILIGTVGLRELTGSGDVRSSLRSAITAAPGDRVIELLPLLTDGISHAVIVTNAQQHVVGIISQTDMLAAVSRMLLGATVAANDVKKAAIPFANTGLD